MNRLAMNRSLTPLQIIVVTFAILGGGSGTAAWGQEPERDPTIPAPKMLEKLAPAPKPQVAAPRPEPTTQRVPPPPLPQIELKSLVLSPSHHGTAIIQVDSRQMVIELDSKKYRAAVTVPHQQRGQAAAKRSNGQADDEDESELAPHHDLLHGGEPIRGVRAREGNLANRKTGRESQDTLLLDPTMFAAGGTLLRLISFHEHMLVFRQIPTGQLVIAR